MDMEELKSVTVDVDMSEEHPRSSSNSLDSKVEKHCKGVNIWAGTLKAAHKWKDYREGSMSQGKTGYDSLSSAEDSLSEAGGNSQRREVSQQCPLRFPEHFSTEKMLEHLIATHAGIFQQLNSYGVVLTLLAAVSSVCILQPLGSFDQGHMQPRNLVACFLLFSSLSFVSSCTGLLVLILGSASLFKPWFHRMPNSPAEEMDPVLYSEECV